MYFQAKWNHVNLCKIEIAQMNCCEHEVFQTSKKGKKTTEKLVVVPRICNTVVVLHCDYF